MDQRRGGNTSGKARKDDGHKLTSQQVRILPDPLASEMMPVVRGSLDEAINVLASCSRIEERAKRTSSVGPTRVCVTAGETAILYVQRSVHRAERKEGNMSNDSNEASVQSIVRRPQCRCDGYGFFWGSEILGWRGNPHDRLICRDCGRPFWFERIWYWFKGYKNK